MMWYLWLSLFVCYCGVTYHSLQQSASPASVCRSNASCYRPLVVPGDEVRMELWLYQPQQSMNESSSPPRSGWKWEPIDTCRFNLTLPVTGKLPTLLTTTNNTTTSSRSSSCKVPLLESARKRSPDPKQVRPQQAKFVFLYHDQAVAMAPFELTRPILRQPSRNSWTTSLTGSTSSSSDKKRSRNLLSESANENQTSSGSLEIRSSSSQADDSTEAMWIPYLKYGRAAVRIRFVAETRSYGPFLERADGIPMPSWNATTYAPLFYIDDLSLPRYAQIELAPLEDEKPPIDLQIKVGALSPVVDAINRQAQQAFGIAESMLPGDELDELRYLLQDERLYRFFLTQIISYVHMWIDYLAFRDEIRFYRGRQNLSGVSTSSVVSRLVCSIIILLYLLDGGGTSWIVILSMMSSCAVEGWKVVRILKPQLSRQFPFVSVRQLKSAQEQETASYDRIASTNLAMVLYPLVIGWSIYALKHYEYASWWSWFISNAANAVYTFGFISLCPQLYVNYRMKSVAHLPWKVFLYKMFNTFVDDAFAWLIEMPWKHRIMTLRDDVVFFMFLLQVYWYRVDKSRTNEFGYSYDGGETDPTAAGSSTTTDPVKAELTVTPALTGSEKTKED